MILGVLKTDKSVNTLPPNHLKLIAKLKKVFSDEVLPHPAFMRFGGTVRAFGSRIVEEGGMKRVDSDKSAFRRRADSKGLLDPGRMAAWDGPDWTPGTARGVHLYEADDEARAEVLE